jgi:uncharacterized linocin/CFP29 family protein
VANKYLAREDAPFDTDVWEALDAAMLETAKAQLAGRRLLPLEGPLGLGAKAVPLRDTEMSSGLIASEMLPVLLIQETFTLGTRDLANFERDGISLDTRPVVEATMKCVQREDELIFEGNDHVPGLLSTDGSREQVLSDWDEVGAAANDLIEAVGKLDEAGFHGPYTLALAPQRYNRLLRLYPRGNKSELDHAKTIAAEGIHKAPVLKGGGVLLSAGRPHASIVIGQDMSIGFIGPAGDRIEFTISESLTVRIRQPQAICILKG